MIAAAQAADFGTSRRNEAPDQLRAALIPDAATVLGWQGSSSVAQTRPRERLPKAPTGLTSLERKRRGRTWLNRVYFEKRSFSSSGSRQSLTQRRSAMARGSRFRRASKSPTRRVRSSALA